MNYFDISKKYHAEAIKHRRHIHQYPEVGFDTQNTEDYIRSFLEEEGIEILESSIGVLGKISAPLSKGTIALRADIDALSLQEETGLDYSSKIPGKMHACGHDFHTAMLMVAAKALQINKQNLEHDVILIFQPAEEGPNLGGARIFVKDFEDSGLIDQIECIYAQHVTPDLSVGHLGYRYGSMMASTDEFDVSIYGRSGHCSQPHLSIDALSAGAHVICSMESFLSRRMDPMDNVVFAVGTFSSGTMKNIIAGSSEFAGTLRCQREKTRSIVLDALKNTLEGYTDMLGITYDLKITRGLPVLQVQEKDVRPFIENLETCVPQAELINLKEPQMGAEDFAFFVEKIPGIFTWLGARTEELPYAPLHNSSMILNEDALVYGIAAMLCFAMEYRGNH